MWHFIIWPCAISDPKQIKAVKKYIKSTRALVEPVAGFTRQSCHNDKAANNIIGAINTFLSSLDEMVGGGAASQQASSKDKQNLTTLMRLLNVLNY